MVTIQRREWLTRGKDNERRRQRRFQLSSTTILHIRSSRSTRTQIFLRSAHKVFLRRKSLLRRKRKKGTFNVLLLLEKTQIRNVQRTSKHFPMNKVDFLMNNVVLRTIRTMTTEVWGSSRISPQSENFYRLC